MDDPIADPTVETLGRPYAWDFIRRFAAVWVRALTPAAIDNVRHNIPVEWIMS